MQPNLDTRKKQVDAWCALILDFHRHHKKYTLDVAESQSSPLFYNKEIDRILVMPSTGSDFQMVNDNQISLLWNTL